MPDITDDVRGGPVTAEEAALRADILKAVNLGWRWGDEFDKDAAIEALYALGARLRSQSGPLPVQGGDLLSAYARSENVSTKPGNLDTSLPVQGGWQPISSAPESEPLLFGAWFEDDCNGYYGESRWKWQASGTVEDGEIWLDATDGTIRSEGFLKVTHWMKPPPAPGQDPAARPEVTG